MVRMLMISLVMLTPGLCMPSCDIISSLAPFLSSDLIMIDDVERYIDGVICR